MRSRQEQLHAYQHGLERVVAALVAHDPDPSRSPFNRSATTALVSVLVAVLALGGNAAYGAIKKPGRAVEANKVLVEKESGALYVYLDADKKLHPVLNYTSGLLVAGGSRSEPTPVARKRLAELTLGAPLGIPNAPQSLPRAGDLVAQPWALCTQFDVQGKGPRTVLAIGGQVTGGRALAAPTPAGPGEALLVVDSRGTEFMVYGGHRFPILNRGIANGAFGWPHLQQPVAVADAWLNTFSEGPRVAAPLIPGLGESSAVARARVGQLYKTEDEARWAVALSDRVVPISVVQAKLIENDPRTSADPPITLTGPAYVTMTKPKPGRPPAALESQRLLPTTAPTLATAARSVCLAVADATAGVTAVLVDPTVPDADPTTGTASAAGARVDHVAVQRGRGVLVEAAASPSAPPGTGTLSVVTDTGMRYALAGPDVLEKLGYGKTTPQRMPAQLVALLPEGPALDSEAAATPPAT